MSEPAPNPGQRRLIEATEGLYLVDAGAGTGKTFAITRRYARLLDETAAEPDDVLLVTFTDNAAAEMRDRVVARSDYDMAALRDAPIGTFHSRCRELLVRHGFTAPTHIGIDDRITEDTRLVDNEVVEAARFREFLADFADDHPEHVPFLQVVSSPEALLGLLGSLLAKGVIPTRDGWYRDGETLLDGDRDAFVELLSTANEPNEGAHGPTQSDLRSSLSGWNRRCFEPDAPTESELRGERGTVRADADLVIAGFDADRTALKAFIHDVFFEYIAFALRRNYLTFGLLLAFAFVLLCEEPSVRESLRYEFVMVDEFQDTNELQFKLTLLLASGNVCVVGDWKQSIYGFQHAAVENITAFESRLETFRDALNDDDTERVPYSVDDVTTIEFTENYRSTQPILDLADKALTYPATGSDDPEPPAHVTSLDAQTDAEADERTRIEAVRTESDEEPKAVLSRIETVVGNTDYAVRDPNDGRVRPPTYDDVAVLTRTRSFGRELQAVADEHGIPVAYEGGIELFDTTPAKLVLAWFRILERGADRGWAPVLERAGYSLAESKALLESRAFPSELASFREELDGLETTAAIARRVCDRYGYRGGVADALVSTLESARSSSYMTRGEARRFLERCFAAGHTVEVDGDGGTDAVTVQTIHAAKGLEHPIVVLANCERDRFPPSRGGESTLRYESPIGLRATKTVATHHGRPHVYDDWSYRAVSAALSTEYDEERRLLYVAMTRARDHLLFSAGPKPATFFESLPFAPDIIDPALEPRAPPTETGDGFDVDVPTTGRRRGLTPHDLMDESVYEDVEAGEGTAFGESIHAFAESYADGKPVSPVDPAVDERPDERNVAAFLDALDGECRTEQRVTLPVDLGDETVTLTGFVDLLVVTEDAVTVVDYKTDRSRHARAEYRLQVSVYWHVAVAASPDRSVTAELFWTATGERDAVEPLEADDLVTAIRAVRDARDRQRSGKDTRTAGE